MAKTWCKAIRPKKGDRVRYRDNHVTSPMVWVTVMDVDLCGLFHPDTVTCLLIETPSGGQHIHLHSRIHMMWVEREVPDVVLR